MRAVVVGSSVVAFAAMSLLTPRAARACGGCFAPPKQVTVVTGHRMAFSIAPNQSVLWDQIQYSGAPQDFAWVLPVRAGANLELSHDEFFAALDAMTSPVIAGPSRNCGGNGGGCAFGGESNASPSAFEGAGGGGVQVISQGVVGPYDTVTVRSTDPNALNNWLVVNGYDIPASTRPIIDAYVGEGFDFIALRLAPGQGIQAMKPVRVVSPGAGVTLPLRMVAAGVGANVGITLYVIGDGRYQAQNFPNGEIDPSKLVWLHATSQSNYQTLAQQVMQGSGGRTWLTEYAQSTSLLASPQEVAASGAYSCFGSATGGASYYGGNSTLAGLYFTQCLCENGAVCGQSRGMTLAPSTDASLDALLEGAAADATDEPESTDSSPDSAAEGASAEASSPEAASPEASASDAADDGATPADASAVSEGGALADAACGQPCVGFDDLALASQGLDPGSTWVTRMRAVLPASALAEGDLVLQAAPSQSAVSNFYTASVYDDPTYDPCGSAGGGCAATDTAPVASSRILVAGSLVFLATALVRRRRRSSARSGD